MTDLAVIEGDKRLWVPPWLEAEGAEDAAGPLPVDGSGRVRAAHVAAPNIPEAGAEVVPASAEVLAEEIRRHGIVREEPEILRARELGILLEPEGDGEDRPGIAGYADTYWTHFDYRSDVAELVRRIQARFPWRLYLNTYFHHPPVHGRRYEFVSFDVWGGGLNDAGAYVGYRGKPLPVELGRRVFNSIFNDPRLPNIYWIIYRGRMWTRGYGWGPAPWGPAGSDARHDWHIHVTCLL